jgi:hypothetical protein
MQADFYDASLRNRLNSNNNSHVNNNSGDCSIENVVINHEFSRWEDTIKYNLDPGSNVKKQGYTSDADLALLKEVKEHIKTFNKPINAANAIVLTHPFYLHLSNMNWVKTGQIKKDANEYLNKLLRLFDMKLPKDKENIVALETLHHYAAATSLFVESGVIDYVILTGAHSGCPVDDAGHLIDDPDYYPYRANEKEIDALSGKRIFVGGAYNHKCLMVSNGYVGKKARAYDFWAIHDLIINKPREKSKTIHPFTFCIDSGRLDFFPRSRVISLEKTLEKIGCAEYAHPN